MTFDLVTLFPGMFLGAFQDGVLARACRQGRVSVRVHDLRRWGHGPHRQVDDSPYGGGGGMVLRPEPIFEAVEWIRRRYPAAPDRAVLLSPQGVRLSHGVARTLAGYERLILICGRYEGVDERVREVLADDEVSIGDVVLTGGEIPAMVVVDAVSRFVPGVLGRESAAESDSFASGILDFPHYTRPARYRDLAVPEVLLSGDHAAVALWRTRKAEEITREKRPDLLKQSASLARDGRSRG